MTGDSAVRYVGSSSVRTDTLLSVTDAPLGTGALLERVDASESAVYNALTALERRGLVTAADDGWRPTGSGRLVAAALSDQRALGRLLESEYWETHDVTPLPPRFRSTAGALADCRVERASDTKPYSLVREVAERLRSADGLDVVSPIYQPEYVRSMPDSADARLVLDESVIEETVGDPEADPEVRVFDKTEVRVSDVDLALSVADSTLILSLPTLDGGYDPGSSIIGDAEEAIQWGRALFEHFWRRATPVESVLDLDDL